MDNMMIQIKRISERLKKDYHAERVVLFGSYSCGEATENSDVDILVIAPTEERFYERIATVLRSVRDLKTGIPLSPIVLSPKEVRSRVKIGDQFIKEILNKGVEI